MLLDNVEEETARGDTGNTGYTGSTGSTGSTGTTLDQREHDYRKSEEFQSYEALCRGEDIMVSYVRRIFLS